IAVPGDESFFRHLLVRALEQRVIPELGSAAGPAATPLLTAAMLKTTWPPARLHVPVPYVA
ncbi:MAG: hypothetical protein ACKO7U_05860, partial [Actinomycetota bacterium]